MRRLMRHRMFGFVLALLLGAMLLSAQSSDPAAGATALEDMLQQTGARLQWDPYRNTGALVRGDDILSFSVPGDVVVENFRTVRRVGAPYRAEGTLYFPEDFTALALRLFPPPQERRRISAIFLDPGHGGRDPGAIGTHRTGEASQTLQEKDVVLAVGQFLHRALSQRYPDKEIVLSRSTDEYLTLEERTQLANGIDAGPNESVIFISIHANASLNAGARGFEVWFLPPEFRRRNLVSAEDIGVEDPDLLSILNTMREEEITLESVLLARNVLSGMDATVGDVSPNRGLREESWYVVRNARMPSILIELGFVTNPEEARNLMSEDYLRELSNGIYTGVTNFVRNFEEVGIE